MKNRLLQHWVSRHAEERPEATAIVSGSTRISYAALERESNQLAHALKEAGCKRGDRVCFLMPKGPTAITTILGILKADCIYTPIDTSSPAPRVAKILDSLDTRWLLAAGPVTNVLDEIYAEERFRSTLVAGWLDGGQPQASRFIPAYTLDDVRNRPTGAVESHNTSDDAAYILFTSGSTGTPKGVVITHANVIYYVDWAVKYFDIKPGDKQSGHIPLHFDLSVFDIFGAFAPAAELHLVPLELNLLAAKLADFIRTSELTQWFSVPSILNFMAKFDVVKQNDFPKLKRLLWCGEVFPTPPLIYWMQRLPHVTFTNLYGPTEATIASSYYTVPKCPDDEKAAIPIGLPCDGESLLVLDEQMHPCPTGEIGDLYIGGVGLSPGYWRDKEKTDAVFVRDPETNERIYKTGDLAKLGEDGLVYFIGRADSQIKSRGYRIELGEIETALNALNVLQECAVVAINTTGFEGAVICCAYVPADGKEITHSSLRTALNKALPAYMMPARWVTLKALPKNANGKIDRPKLREAFTAGENKHVPAS